MPGKITELAAQTGAGAALTDLLETVDVSDTSMASSGTNKKLTLSEMISFLTVNGVGGVTNGDKVDITVSGNNWTIDSGAVTYAKIQNISATSRVLGRVTGGAGVVEELTGANLSTIIGLTAAATMALPVTVANGGTGVGTLSGLLKGNGTSALSTAAAGTDYLAPGGALGTPSSGTLTNCTGLPTAGVVGLDTALTNKQAADADLTTIAGLTVTNTNVIGAAGGVWTSMTPATVKTNLALTKSDVGLGNVDNTSDANKPVSTAMGAALDTKADVSMTTAGLSNKQPLDTELTVIAGLTPSDTYVIQSSGGTWASRSPAQLAATLPYVSTSAAGLVSQAPNSTLHFLRGDATWALLPAMVPNPGTVTPAMLATADFGSFSVNAGVATIDSNVITDAMTVAAAGSTFKGNPSASSSTPTNMTPTQASTLIAYDNNADANKTRKYLTADGTWNYIRRPVTALTGTLYTANALGDENKFITLNNAATITVFTYNDAGAAFPIGAEIDFMQLGAGQVVFQASTGNLYGTPGLKLRAQYSAATLKKTAADTWIVIGDLSA